MIAIWTNSVIKKNVKSKATASHSCAQGPIPDSTASKIRLFNGEGKLYPMAKKH